MSKKQKYLYIAIAVAIIGIYGALTLFSFFTNTPEKQDQIPTPTQIQISQIFESPLDEIQQHSQEGEPLTSKEKLIKESLITRADSNGLIYQEDAFSLFYLKDYQAFQARLTAFPLEDAENEALLWLQSEGLSSNGVCKLPTILYVTKRALGENQEFNSIPTPCR